MANNVSNASQVQAAARGGGGASSAIGNRLKTLIKVGFAVALIYWMIHKGILDLNAFAALATPGLITFCLLCIFMQLYINNYRWVVLMRTQGLPSTIGHTLPLSFIGLFFSFVMPGGVGGDVIKGYYILQDFPHKKAASAVSIFMDRMIGFFVMIATAFVALFFNWHDVFASRELRSVAAAVTILFLGFMVFFSFSLSRRLGRYVFDTWFGNLLFVRLPGGAKLRLIYDCVHSYRKSPSALAKTIFLSALSQLPTVALVYIIALAMGVHEIPLAVYFFLVPVGVVVLALPISPAGIGVGQAAFYFLFSLYLGKSNQLGATAVTVMQVTNFIWGLLGCYFYLNRKKPVLPAEA